MDAAKLGIEIDASSAVKAEGQMRSFGQTATKAAQDTEASISRMEARMAQLPAGIARAEASIARLGSSKLVSTNVVDLDAQSKSISEFEGHARRLANIRLDDALAKSGAAAVTSAGGLNQVAEAAVHATGAHSGLNLIMIKAAEASGLGYRAGLQIAQVTSMLGPAGYVATGAILTLGAGYLTATADARGFANEQDKVLKLMKTGDVKAMSDAFDAFGERISARDGVLGYLLEVGQRIKGIVTGDFVTTEKLGGFQGTLGDEIFIKQKAQQSEITRGEQEKIRLIGADMPTAIRAQGAALETELIPKYEKAGLSAQAAGDKAKNLAAAWTGAKLNEFTAQQMKADLAIQQQVTDLQFANAAIDATERQTIALTAAQKINALQTSDNATQHHAATQELIAETAAQARLQTVQSFKKTIDTGKSAAGDFEKNFGVKLNTDESIKNLASSFANNFNTLKNDPSQQKPLADAFQSFVQQAVARGTQNISGLLQSVNISPADIQRLRSQLASITTGFDTQQVEQVSFRTNAVGGRERTTEMVEQQIPIVQKLGEAFDDADRKQKNWADAGEAAKVVKQYGDIGVAVDDTNKKLNDLQSTVAQGMATNMDVSQPKTAIESVKTWLGEIPLVTYRTIEFQTVASGSPTKPFSEYFDTYMPSKINAIGGLSPEIRYSVQDYDKRLREITNLGNQANAARADAFNATHGLGGYGQGQPGANAYGAATSNQFADRISAQAADLLSSLNADVWRAQQQSGQRTSGPGANAGGSGGGGGGGGDVNVNIDLSGATLSREFLDEELIPALERGVIRATGKDPNLRVFS